MQRGLDGRRVAAVSGGAEGGVEERLLAVLQPLEQAGALIQRLGGDSPDEDFHGAKYAAVVLVGDSSATFSGDPRVVQLVREFLASDKPVAALGSGMSAILAAGGAASRSIAAHAPLAAELEGAGARSTADPMCVDDGLITAGSGMEAAAFGARLARELSEHLDDRAVDEMSDLSFPASDPPATAPARAGRADPEPRA